MFQFNPYDQITCIVRSYWTVRVYLYGPTVRVWSDRMSIRIRSGPYAYGPNTHMVWNIYTSNIYCNFMYECMNVNCMHVFCLRASMKIRLVLIELPSLNKEFIIIIIIIIIILWLVVVWKKKWYDDSQNSFSDLLTFPIILINIALYDSGLPKTVFHCDGSYRRLCPGWMIYRLVCFISSDYRLEKAPGLIWGTTCVLDRLCYIWQNIF